MNLSRIGNKYLADNEPWNLYKTNPERVKTILYVALQITANLMVASEPFLPFTSTKMKQLLNVSEVLWDNFGKEFLKPGHTINEPSLLFEKIEDEAIEFQINKLMKTKEENKKANVVLKPGKEHISYDDFVKLDIRTATILEAEKVPKTDKLLKLKLDTGIDIRTVVSGIAEHYKPEDIIGKQVQVLVNLQPRTLKGIESQGMILTAETPEGKLCFMLPEHKIENGSTIT
jgi:methionyl-tRNA synthetase